MPLRCRDIVRGLDLSELYADYSPQGGDAYDPGTLLATWFFAYSEGVSSTRRLEELCGRDMHYIYVSANLQPDHTTLSRFRQRHAARMSDYFVQIIRLAVERNVSDFRRITTDGSKFQATCSSRQNRDARELETGLAKVKEEIAQYLRRSELLDEEEGQELSEVRQKIERLKERATTVEPAIGNLKSNLGFRRFRLRGKAKAAAEFLLICIGHNLGKLHALMGGHRRGAAAAAITLKAPLSFVGQWLRGFTDRILRPSAPLVSHAA